MGKKILPSHTTVNTNFSVGDKHRVKSRDGSGGTREYEGTLIDPNDQGFVVIEDDKGDLIYIPLGGVVEIRQSRT